MNQQGSTASLAAWRRDAIRKMRRSRAATLRLLSSLPQRVVLQPKSQGQWSIKDVLAHIVAWEEEAVKRLQLIADGKGDQILFYDDMAAADAFNARAVAASRKRSLAALLNHTAQVRQQLIKALKQIPPDSLNDPSHRYPVIAWLPEFAWTHERDHRQRIRAWWKQRRLQSERS
jgi:uncharacterized damage-inducible protein DinB